MGAALMLLLALATATCLAEDADGAAWAEDGGAEVGGRSEWEEALFTTEEAAPVPCSLSPLPRGLGIKPGLIRRFQAHRA